jgi:uncharacterized protein
MQRYCVIKSMRFSLLLFLLLSSCAHFNTGKRQYAGMEAALRKGNFATPLAKVKGAKDSAYKQKDRVVYYLDAGMLYHWNGNYVKSNELLERAERAIEDLFTKSLSRSASALLLNDNIQSYSGEDYEDIYLNVFKALNYLALGQNDAAFVEVRRINDKLVQLDQKYVRTAERLNEAGETVESFKAGRNRFTESALGRYLSMLLYRNEYKWDDVRIDFEKIDEGWNRQPAIHPFLKPDFSAEKKRVISPTARLNVFAFSGIGPDKEASTFYIHTEQDLIILGSSQENYLGGQELSNLSFLPWPGVNPGYHFKFQLPYLVKRPSLVGRIEVITDTGHVKELSPIESLENAAIEAFRIKKPILYLRAVTRSVSKGIAAEQAKAELTRDMDSNVAFFTRILTDIAVDSTENADRRISRFFPARASVAELHLNEGTYSIRVNYYSRSGTLLYTDLHSSVTIKADQLNILQSAYLN